MKLFFTVLLSFLFGSALATGISITTPTVSGHWTIAGSPYTIYDTITLNGGDTLTIDPGVEVIFHGPYPLIVKGVLNAAGMPGNYIDFHVFDTLYFSDAATVAGGWGGIKFYELSGTPVFNYCNVHDVKGSDFEIWRDMVIKNCNFYHCGHNGNLGNVITDASSWPINFEMDSCNFYDNTDIGNVVEFEFGDTCIFRNNSMHDNATHANIFSSVTPSTINTVVYFENNQVYNNTMPDSIFGSAVMLQARTGFVRNNLIHDNMSMYDAPIGCYNGYFDVSDNMICNNSILTGFHGGTACGWVQGGGGIRMEYVIGTIRNNIIANNYAAFAGGGLYIIESDVVISNNDIINNEAGYMAGALYFSGTYDTNYVKLKNNIIYGNITTMTGGGAYQSIKIANIDATVNVAFDHNYLDFPLAMLMSTNFGYASFGDSATNIIDSASMGLVAPTTVASTSASALTANFNLATTSRCINKGDTVGADVEVYDYAGNARTWGKTIDIGAYQHTQRVLVPQLSNDHLSVYPNPVTNQLTVEGARVGSAILMYDLLGQQVYTGVTTSERQTINANSLKPGTYLLVLVDSNGTRASRTIVKE